MLLCCQKQKGSEPPRRSDSANHQSEQQNSERCVLYLDFHILSVLLPLIIYPVSQKTLSLMKLASLLLQLLSSECFQM